MNRHCRIGGGMSNNQHHHRFLGRGPFANAVEKLHGVWRVGERRKTSIVQRRNQEACCNTDAFVDIIILLVIAGI